MIFNTVRSGEHYTGVIMSAIASQITSLTIVYSAVYSGADQRTYQSSASLAFVWGIHWWLVNSPHKGPVARKTFPFDDVIMITAISQTTSLNAFSWVIGILIQISLNFLPRDPMNNMPTLLSDTTSYIKISIIIEPWWSTVEITVSPCNLTCTSAAPLLSRLSNVISIRQLLF